MAQSKGTLKELIVPFVIIACIATMILPVPPFVLDYLLVANLTMALILLLSTLYITDSLKLSALPTILLLSTLYRLALNIASTRLVLGHGDAGEVIEAFGKVVIAGNLVVGLVIFLIITLVQFIVIAKGSERVAEVSARFTLDALPGKQMSIDADVRSGLIDAETAREKRDALQSESRFYGALDGAMKFVKGDAIAGLVITAVNILGGFGVGLMLRSMSFSAALHQYTTLSVGDGLVSQIPALLNALAAGIVVTRVTKGGETTSLAGEVIAQLGQIQKTKVMVAILAFIMGMIPGMPFVPFLMVGLFLLTSAFLGSTPEIKAESPAFSPVTAPLIGIKVTDTILKTLQSENSIVQSVESLRERVYEHSGLLIPRPCFMAFAADEQKTFKEQIVHFQLRGLTIARKRHAKTETVTSTHLMNEIFDFLKGRSTELLDDIMTRRILDTFDNEYPELVSAVVPTVISMTQLTELLRKLSEEGLSIRHFDLILQAIAESAAEARNERVLLEEVRIALKRLICNRVAQDDTIKATMLDPILDLSLAVTEKEAKPFDPSHLKLIGSELQRIFEDDDDLEKILICSRGSRRLIYEGLRAQGISAYVIAHEEITKETTLNVLHTIRLEDTAGAEQVIMNLAA
jgi:type III secretion protein V